MKQHISVEQIKEFGIIEKITKWLFYNDKETESLFAPMIQMSLIQIDNSKLYKPFSEYMTIGKMIEMLSNSDPIKIEKSIGWCVSFNSGHSSVNANELCDSLWQAVKEVL